MARFYLTTKEFSDLKRLNKAELLTFIENRFVSKPRVEYKKNKAKKKVKSAFGFIIRVYDRNGYFWLQTYIPFNAGSSLRKSTRLQIKIKDYSKIDKTDKYWYLLSSNANKIIEAMAEFEEGVINSIISRTNAYIKDPENKLLLFDKNYFYRHLRKYPEFYFRIMHGTNLDKILDKSELLKLQQLHNTPSIESLKLIYQQLRNAPLIEIKEFADGMTMYYLKAIRRNIPDFYDLIQRSQNKIKAQPTAKTTKKTTKNKALSANSDAKEGT